MAKVAFIGTGLLGSAIVEGLLRRGDAVTVWNRTAAKARALERFGARVAASAGDACVDAERVHFTLSDDSVVDPIVEEIRPRLTPGATVIDHTTTSPRGARARVERLAGDGVRFLHAPVFMSPMMARESKGIIMVSGPRNVFDDVRGVLEAMTGEVWYLGEDGQMAAALKLFGNSMIFSMTGGIADILAMAKALGIAPTDALSVFTKFQVGGVIKLRGEKMARGDFDATFELTMARKDMRLMLEAADGQPLTVLPSVAKRMDEAIAKGHGRDDLGAIAAGVVR
jgi:3-hydroxyisobutyrate dehydrogenase